MFHSLNPVEDAIAHGNWLNSLPDEEPEMKECQVDGLKYPIEECVYDKDGTCHVAIINITEYLAPFERDMLTEDYNHLKQNLLKQIPK